MPIECTKLYLSSQIQEVSLSIPFQVNVRHVNDIHKRCTQVMLEKHISSPGYRGLAVNIDMLAL